VLKRGLLEEQDRAAGLQDQVNKNGIFTFYKSPFKPIDKETVYRKTPETNPEKVQF
jgi:hypothetical protein